MVSTISSEAAVHVPAGSSVVRVSITEPAVISAAEGVYTAFNKVALLKLPVPEVDQAEEAALPPLEPFNKYVLPSQIVASEPALAVAAWFMDNIILSLTAPQGPAGSLVVMVSVTVPAAISAGEGVYTAFNKAALLNVPDPEVVQVDEVALPPREPLSV